MESGLFESRSTVLPALPSSSIALCGFPDGSMVKNMPANAGDTRDAGSVPVSGRSPEEGNDNLLQYSYLENAMGKGASWATVHGVAGT